MLKHIFLKMFSSQYRPHNYHCQYQFGAIPKSENFNQVKQIRNARKDDFLSFYGFKEKAELLKLEISTFLKKQALKNLIT